MNEHVNVHSAFAQYFSQDALTPWLYQLSKAMDAGHVCLNTANMAPMDGESEMLNPKILNGHRLVGDESAILPFILHREKLYLHRFFHYEKRLVQRIKDLCDRPIAANIANSLPRLSAILNQLFPTNSNTDPDWQKIACTTALLNQFSILSGGPGTGKTTTITKLLALLFSAQPECKVVLCAPTGKAAARMEESIRQSEKMLRQCMLDESIIQQITNLKAATIHSTLGYQANSIHFRHNARRPLDADVLIVDECSMIDLALFYKLFEAIDLQRTKVILLGDKNQLASVEAGSVFRDLCTAAPAVNTFHQEQLQRMSDMLSEEALHALPMSHEKHRLNGRIIELQKSHRFSDERGIGKLSKAILNNEQETLQYYFDQTEEEEVAIFPPTALNNCINYAAKALYRENGGYIGEEQINSALERMTNSTILCAVKEGKNGVYAVNNQIVQQVFKPSGPFFHNQLIMVSKNQPRENVYNGDMALLRETTRGIAAYFRKGPDDYLQLNPAQILAQDTAFAMTIHKSQGSEFNEVLIILPEKKDNLLLTKELLYTAITRAKKKVKIVGTEEVIRQIATQSVQRISGIADHF
ncbi:MAG TPA: exodeoxyribonuclease V subunit alpha [Edaphocola sp.]|nr:exodeoxyribonuclease V subunit alpha [Edaphocola sp.]